MNFIEPTENDRNVVKDALKAERLLNDTGIPRTREASRRLIAVDSTDNLLWKFEYFIIDTFRATPMRPPLEDGTTSADIHKDFETELTRRGVPMKSINPSERELQEYFAAFVADAHVAGATPKLCPTCSTPIEGIFNDGVWMEDYHGGFAYYTCQSHRQAEPLHCRLCQTVLLTDPISSAAAFADMMRKEFTS